ncbi:hypothetical protein J1N35_023152 [Gossypium stocksii]|uniref:Uncharacterized protein n=1 Tax=Gossypium stocksii TaxID=47602 RepID=A0A9D4A1T9_9ROSI|nr:hypothetical protein J1N35_023152 [Gossypium stocksii]
MSPDGDGAINGCCPCSLSLSENGIPGSHDDTCKHCTRSKSLSSSPSALGSDSVILVDSNKLWRIFVASAKGFSIGAGLKGGLALFSILARLLRKKSRKVEAFTNKEAISLAIKETLRYGLFLGTFAECSFLDIVSEVNYAVLERVEHMGYEESQSGNTLWLHSSSDHYWHEL